MRHFLLKIKLSSYFYKPLVLISILLTVLLSFMDNIMELILLVKLFLLSLIFLENQFFNSKDRLLFYKNFGITPRFLFITVFLMDFFVSLFVFKLTNLTL